MKLGATGEFPQGKLNESDEGEIKIAVTEKDGAIFIEFGKPVAWLGMHSIQARTIGEMLIMKANLIERRSRGAKTEGTENLDWDEALQHFREVRKRYQDLIVTPGVNTTLALENVFHPLAMRFYRGERSPELFEAMMAVE